MIKTLSPYYITIPWVAPISSEVGTSVIVQIFVWNGSKSTPPTNATYEVIKDNATESTDAFKLNIANWISDFITLTQQEGATTEVIDGNNQYWVKWLTYYETSETNDLTVASNINTKLFSRGYSYGMDGENVELATGFLMPTIEYKVSKNSVFSIPYLMTESEVVTPEIVITNVIDLGGDDYEFYFTYIGSYDSFNFEFNQGAGLPYVNVIVGATSPQTVSAEDGGSYTSYEMSGYDNDSGTFVTSNTFVI